MTQTCRELVEVFLSNGRVGPMARRGPRESQAELIVAILIAAAPDEVPVDELPLASTTSGTATSMQVTRARRLLEPYAVELIKRRGAQTYTLRCACGHGPRCGLQARLHPDPELAGRLDLGTGFPEGSPAHHLLWERSTERLARRVRAPRRQWRARRASGSRSGGGS